MRASSRRPSGVRRRVYHPVRLEFVVRRRRELVDHLPMDLAAAALVRVAEREDLTRIFTLDRRQFSVYRPGRRRRFSIVPQ
jgi:hypothetical protein